MGIVLLVVLVIFLIVAKFEGVFDRNLVAPEVEEKDKDEWPDVDGF